MPVHGLKPSRESQPASSGVTVTAESIRSATPLTREFFARDAITVGRELLAKLLVRREGRRLLAGRIVEDEAYLGAADPAAHAYNGRTTSQCCTVRSRRTRVRVFHLRQPLLHQRLVHVGRRRRRRIAARHGAGIWNGSNGRSPRPRVDQRAAYIAACG